MTIARVKLQGVFFDSKLVQRKLDEASRRNLAQGGAAIRTTARRSMRPGRRVPADGQQLRDEHGRSRTSGVRKVRKHSRPGEPPRVWSGELRKLLFFSYDTRSESMVVGPVKFKAGKAPSTLEYGGRVRVVVRKGGKKRIRTAQVAPRPYMGPALRKVESNLPKLWRNSLGGGG